MKVRLSEVELNSDNPEAAKAFYEEILGLELYVDEKGLKVFGSGTHDLDIIESPHFPGRVSISFFADNIQSWIDELSSKGVRILERFGDPVSASVLQDPDGCRIEIKKQHG